MKVPPILEKTSSKTEVKPPAMHYPTRKAELAPNTPRMIVGPINHGRKRMKIKGKEQISVSWREKRNAQSVSYYCISNVRALMERFLTSSESMSCLQ